MHGTFEFYTKDVVELTNGYKFAKCPSSHGLLFDKLEVIHDQLNQKSFYMDPYNLQRSYDPRLPVIQNDKDISEPIQHKDWSESIVTILRILTVLRLVGLYQTTIFFEAHTLESH